MSSPDFYTGMAHSDLNFVKKQYERFAVNGVMHSRDFSNFLYCCNLAIPLQKIEEYRLLVDPNQKNAITLETVMKYMSDYWKHYNTDLHEKDLWNAFMHVAEKYNDKLPKEDFAKVLCGMGEPLTMGEVNQLIGDNINREGIVEYTTIIRKLLKN